MAGKTISPPTDYALASPQIGVEIWPHNGGPIILSGNQAGVLQAQISKNIRTKEGGKFMLEIAPGGASGVEDPISWTSLLNPASLVIIYLSRGSSKRIVMLGIMNSIEESQIWKNGRVVRTIRIQGCDFSFFFNAFSYYTLTYLGLTPTDPGAAAAWIMNRFKGQFQGTPDSVCIDWLGVMLGGNTGAHAKGVLESTYVMYNGNKIFLFQLFAYWFEAFIEAAVVQFPFYADYFNSEGNWMDRFLTILTWPYYEFFITTAGEGDYPDLDLVAKGAISGHPFGYAKTPDSVISVTGYNTVWPTIVGRVNPLPWTTYPDLGGTPDPIQRDRWDNLFTYNFSPYSFIDSVVQYNANETYNFFGVNTVITNAIASTAGSSTSQLYSIELLGAIIDRNSINAYGFRPYYNPTRWLTNPTTGVSKTPGFDINSTGNVLLGKLASYYIPTPNLLEGILSIPMWPDVLPGNKLVYRPFKSNDDYEFYIEGVTHTYVYGGSSKTSIEVSRGAKLTDYNDATILSGMHLDSYIRVGGLEVPRTDLNDVPPAYHIAIGTATGAALGAGPWAASPKTITPNSKVSPPSFGWPTGTNNSYDDDFQVAVGLTSCGTNKLDWRLVKALAMTESKRGLIQSSVSSTGALGIMQVQPNAHPEYNPVLLASDPIYNINAGTTIFCDLILANPGNLLKAMSDYKGFALKGGYSNPVCKAAVDLAIKWATEAGVPNLP